MKKFVVSSIFAITAVSSFAAEPFCETKEMLKVGGYGAAAGAAVSLLVPGAGPFIATSLLTGTVATTANVAVCAIDESDRKSKLDAFNKANSIEKKVSEVIPVEDKNTILNKAMTTSTVAYVKVSDSVTSFYNNLTK